MTNSGAQAPKVKKNYLRKLMCQFLFKYVLSFVNRLLGLSQDAVVKSKVSEVLRRVRDSIGLHSRPIGSCPTTGSQY